MFGIEVLEGVRSSSRIDPAQITLGAGILYERKVKNDTSPEWTLDANLGSKKLGKEGKPSEANHGNVKPVVDSTTGGFTISRAIQTTVLSLTTLRRLRFPLNGVAEFHLEVDIAARTVLAALGLAAASLTRDESADLRSRCHLVAQQKPIWELIDVPGKDPKQFELTGSEAVTLFKNAMTAAKEVKVKDKENNDLTLPWEGEIVLKPSDDLLKLVAGSQELAMHKTVEGGD
jgi:CRISPR-associated protein Csb1